MAAAAAGGRASRAWLVEVQSALRDTFRSLAAPIHQAWDRAGGALRAGWQRAADSAVAVVDAAVAGWRSAVERWRAVDLADLAVNLLHAGLQAGSALGIGAGVWKAVSGATALDVAVGAAVVVTSLVIGIGAWSAPVRFRSPFGDSLARTMQTAVVGLIVATPSVVLATIFGGTASNAAFGVRGGLNLVPPQSGWLAVLQAMPLVSTFMVNVAWLVPATVNAIVAGAALNAWISGLYAATAAMFGLSVMSSAYRMAHNPMGAEPGEEFERGERFDKFAGRLVTWFAFPGTSNVGNVLLVISYGWVAGAFDPVMLAISTVLSVTFANASVLGMVQARTRRFGSTYLKVMGAAGNVSLLYWGMLALWPGQWLPLVVAGAAVGIGLGVVRGVSKFDAWRARLINSPPGFRSFVVPTAKAVAPGLLMGVLAAGVLVHLDPSQPVLITVVSGGSTATVLWVLHRLVPHSGGGTSGRTQMQRWIGGGAVTGMSKLLRGVRASVRAFRARFGR